MADTHLESFDQLSNLIKELQKQLDILLLNPYNTEPSRRARELLSTHLDELRNLRWLLVLPNLVASAAPGAYRVGRTVISYTPK
jgi:hypothetical protein